MITDLPVELAEAVRNKDIAFVRKHIQPKNIDKLFLASVEVCAERIIYICLDNIRDPKTVRQAIKIRETRVLQGPCDIIQKLYTHLRTLQ